jgi:hypothetical protein
MSSSQPPAPKSAGHPVDFVELTDKDRKTAEDIEGKHNNSKILSASSAVANWSMTDLFAQLHHTYKALLNIPHLRVEVAQDTSTNPTSFVAYIGAIWPGTEKLRETTMLLMKSSNSAGSARDSLEDLNDVVKTHSMEISVSELKRLGEAGYFDEETVRNLEEILNS